jgi:hypothetical protein
MLLRRRSRPMRPSGAGGSAVHVRGRRDGRYILQSLLILSSIYSASMAAVKLFGSDTFAVMQGRAWLLQRGAAARRPHSTVQTPKQCPPPITQGKLRRARPPFPSPTLVLPQICSLGAPAAGASTVLPPLPFLRHLRSADIPSAFTAPASSKLQTSIPPHLRCSFSQPFSPAHNSSGGSKGQQTPWTTSLTAAGSPRDVPSRM